MLRKGLLPIHPGRGFIVGRESSPRSNKALERGEVYPPLLDQVYPHAAGCSIWTSKANLLFAKALGLIAPLPHGAITSSVGNKWFILQHNILDPSLQLSKVYLIMLPGAVRNEMHGNRVQTLWCLVSRQQGKVILLFQYAFMHCTHTHTHTHTHSHTHTHTHACAHTHARTDTHSHSHTPLFALQVFIKTWCEWVKPIISSPWTILLQSIGLLLQKKSKKNLGLIKY